MSTASWTPSFVAGVVPWSRVNYYTFVQLHHEILPSDIAVVTDREIHFWPGAEFGVLYGFEPGW
jgi:hypothetical protein